MDSQTIYEIKKLDVLLKSLSDLLSESDVLLFPINKFEEANPSVSYFEIIQEVFAVKTPAKVLCN